MPERDPGRSLRPYGATPDLYDLMYGGQTADVEFYVGRACALRGPVLEVACGNGRVLVPTRAAGVDVDGLDGDLAMLDDARRKLDSRGLDARLVQADMRDFTLPRRYDLVTIPFNTFCHNLTQADQLATLRCCREHLESGGALVFDVFFPDPARLREHDGTPRVTIEHPHPAGEDRVRVLDAVTSDPIEQVMHVRRTVEIAGRDGRVTATHAIEWDLRWVWRAEMELLLAAAGFQRREVEGRSGARDGFARKERPDASGSLVWTAWKD